MKLVEATVPLDSETCELKDEVICSPIPNIMVSQGQDDDNRHSFSKDEETGGSQWPLI